MKPLDFDAALFDFKTNINIIIAQWFHLVHSVWLHCATAFSMQSWPESAYQPYADEYH